jgi:hypothetical protein
LFAARCVICLSKGEELYRFRDGFAAKQ